VQADGGYVHYSQYVRYALTTTEPYNVPGFQSNLRVLHTSRASRAVRACHTRIIVDPNHFCAHPLLWHRDQPNGANEIHPQTETSTTRDAEIATEDGWTRSMDCSNRAWRI
jgi:hypothetical protein